MGDSLYVDPPRHRWRTCSKNQGEMQPFPYPRTSLTCLILVKEARRVKFPQDSGPMLIAIMTLTAMAHAPSAKAGVNDILAIVN